jgi:nucleotide-binding universal stress UspA family protein
MRYRQTGMRRILACVDLSETSEKVVDCAVSLTAAGDELVILHVAAPEPDFVGYDPDPKSMRDQVAKTLRDEHQAVQRIAERIRSTGLTVMPLTVQGATVARIAEHAERLGAALVVVASHGRGLLHELVVGSVVTGLLRTVTIPVVVVPVHAT